MRREKERFIHKALVLNGFRDKCFILGYVNKKENQRLDR